MTDESKITGNYVSSRPDATASLLNQRRYEQSIGFESKALEATGNRYNLIPDLIRIGIFSKESVNINNMATNLNFRSVGKLHYISIMIDFNFHEFN